MASSVSVVDQCDARARKVLERSTRPAGLVASAELTHYAGLWTRDAAITTLGANLSNDPGLLDASRRTIETLSPLASRHGQIPNAYWPERMYWDWGEAGCTDASAWFVIAAAHYFRVTGDRSFADRVRMAVIGALTWLEFQDANNFVLIDSPEAADWMDSSLSRSGKVFYVNVLYASALRSGALLAPAEAQRYLELADLVTDRLDFLFWPRPNASYEELLSHVPYPDNADRRFPHTASRAAYAHASRAEREFYLSHVQFGRFVDRCDVLANLLAVVLGTADEDKAGRIMAYLERTRAASPYPIKSWPEPIQPDDPWGMYKPAAEEHQPPRWHNPPFQYHNGGIWPFIGGFYVAALTRVGRTEEAKATLTALAEANRVAASGEWGFHEWLDGRTGMPGGASGQAWNAGTFLLAQAAVRSADLELI
jgi:glycogen debranching enzyme